jgi:putative sigma-54 modulation protein
VKFRAAEGYKNLRLYLLKIFDFGCGLWYNNRRAVIIPTDLKHFCSPHMRQPQKCAIIPFALCAHGIIAAEFCRAPILRRLILRIDRAVKIQNFERSFIMKVTMIGRKVNLKDSFKDFAEKKLSKLDRFFSDDADAVLTVTVEKNRQTVELTVRDMGMVFRAEESADDMMNAMDVVVDVIIRQLRKNKTRLEKRMRSAAFAGIDFADDGETAGDFEIVRSKMISLKPMDVEEAILQMELTGHMFYMFENADTGEVNVVYRRKDGRYGLLESSRE